MTSHPLRTWGAGVERPWQALARPEALGWRVGLAYLPWGLIGPLVVDPVYLGGPWSRWLVVAIVQQAVLMATLAISGLALRRGFPRGTPPLVAAASIVLAVCMRALAITLSVELLGLSDAPELRYRFTAAIILGSAILGMIGATFGLRAQRQQEVADLTAQSERLAALTAEMPARMAEVERKLVIQVSLACEPHLQQLDRSLRAEAATTNAREGTVDRLRNYVDDELRPLSHRLATTAVPVRDVGPGTQAPGIGPGEQWSTRGSTLVEPALAVLAFLAALNQVLRDAPLDVLSITTAGLYAIVVLVLLVAARLLLRVTVTNRVGVALVGILTGATFVAAQLVVAALPLADPQHGPVAAALIGGALGLFVAAARASDMRMAVLEEELAASVQQQEDLLSVLRQHAWVARRRVGYALHGPLQAALTAATMRLSSGDASDADIARIREDIRAALARVDPHEPTDVTLASVCDDLAVTWDGTCAVDWHIAPMAQDALAESSTLTECASAIVVECVQNAVRHGAAARVGIEIDVEGATLVAVVTDDGSLRSGASGLGSSMLDELCTQWTRSVVDGATRVEARLAAGAQV